MNNAGNSENNDHLLNQKHMFLYFCLPFLLESITRGYPKVFRYSFKFRELKDIL